MRRSGSRVLAVTMAATLVLAACERNHSSIDVQTGARLASSYTPGLPLPTSGPAPTAAELPGAASLPAATYDAAQAERGQRVYQAVCAKCHPSGSQSGAAFTTAWNNRRVSDLHSILVNTMPQNKPGSLSEQQYIDVIAYMLKMNNVAAGAPLSSDTTVLRKQKIGVPTQAQ